MKKIPFIFALACLGIKSPAQSLLKDLVLGKETYGGKDYPASSNPYNFTVANNTLFFAATDKVTGSATNGHQVWKSDGTAAGTVFLKVLKSPYSGFTNLTKHFTNANGIVFFTHCVQGSHYELWKTDGTEAGTVMVKQFYNTVNGYDEPQGFCAIGNTVYFTANDGNGIELWKSDGTAGGTAEVIDLDTRVVGGSKIGGLSPGGPLIPFNGKVYFPGEAGNSDTELYSSDGTSGGTGLVKDIKVGGNGSSPSNFIVFNNVLYFQAAGQMWKTDGTAGGTLMVSTEAFNGPVIFKNKIYFNNQYPGALCSSDGTTTTVLKDSVGSISGANNDYLFTLYNKSIPTPPYVLPYFYKSDGTAAGTVRIPYYVGASASFNVIGNKMYTTRLDSGQTTGYNVWESDGTYAGTKKTPLGSTGFQIYKNSLFYCGTDTVAGNELWIYTPDGSAPSRISSLEEANKIHVYPNPSNGTFNISLNRGTQKAELVVTNLLGEKVYARHLENPEETLNLAHLKNGIYLFQILTEKGMQTQKIILQK